jgi:hypothetical protein
MPRRALASTSSEHEPTYLLRVDNVVHSGLIHNFTNRREESVVVSFASGESRQMIRHLQHEHQENISRSLLCYVHSRSSF